MTPSYGRLRVATGVALLLGLGAAIQGVATHQRGEWVYAFALLGMVGTLATAIVARAPLARLHRLHVLLALAPWLWSLTRIHSGWPALLAIAEGLLLHRALMSTCGLPPAGARCGSTPASPSPRSAP